MSATLAANRPMLTDPSKLAELTVPVPADDLTLLRFFLYETLSKMTLRYETERDVYVYEPNEPFTVTAEAHAVLMRLLEPNEPVTL